MFRIVSPKLNIFDKKENGKAEMQWADSYRDWCCYLLV